MPFRRLQRGGDAYASPEGSSSSISISSTPTSRPSPLSRLLFRARKSSGTEIYIPLPEDGYVRVLHLSPGSPHDPIKCRLKATPLEDMIDRYEAISYVWGDPSVTEKILCNGKKVQITTNLADALRAFRHRRRVRVLWADALCINQADKDERGNQVRHMGKVFEHAERVLAWLGRDEGGIAEDAFQLIEETNAYLDALYVQYGLEYPSHLPALDAALPLCLDKEKWAHIDKLLRLPWFERVWVIQEAALAKECELWWGTHQLSVAHVFELLLWSVYKMDFHSLLRKLDLLGYPDSLSDVFELIHVRYVTTKTWQHSLPVIKWLSQRQEKGLFLEILDTGRLMEASDPRDHVYAFLGCPLAKNPDGQLIVDINYEASVDNVYLETACALIQDKREGSQMLSCVWHPDVESLMQSSLPSWVPHWNIGPRPMKSIGYVGAWYRAGGPQETFSAEVRASRQLHMTGCVFDKVAWMSSTIESAEVEMHSEYWSSQVHASGKPFIDMLWESVSKVAPIMEDDFALTLSQGYAASPSKPVDLNFMRVDFAEYRRRVRAEFSSSPESELVVPEGANAHDFENRLRYCQGWRLMVTQQGRLGLIPGLTTRIGDVCCVIEGASVPFVLTPVGAGRFKLVGDCYVHDAMNGEIMDLINRGQLHSETLIFE